MVDVEEEGVLLDYNLLFSLEAFGSTFRRPYTPAKPFATVSRHPYAFFSSVNIPC